MQKRLTKAQVRKRMRLLRDSLHYWQMMYRMEKRWLKGSEENVQYFASEMRKLQKENKPQTGDKMSAKT